MEQAARRCPAKRIHARQEWQASGSRGGSVTVRPSRQTVARERRPHVEWRPGSFARETEAIHVDANRVRTGVWRRADEPEPSHRWILETLSAWDLMGPHLLIPKSVFVCPTSST